MNTNELKVNISFNGEEFLKNVDKDMVEHLRESVKDNIKNNCHGEIVSLPIGTKIISGNMIKSVKVIEKDLLREKYDPLV